VIYVLDDSGDPSSMVKRRISQCIDEILEKATKDQKEALEEAVRLYAWLRKQQTTGQAELDRQEGLDEAKDLIDILRNT
jgi:hypothetical protein